MGRDDRQEEGGKCKLEPMFPRNQSRDKGQEVKKGRPRRATRSKNWRRGKREGGEDNGWHDGGILMRRKAIFFKERK